MKSLKTFLKIIPTIFLFSFLPGNEKYAAKTYDGRAYNTSLMMDFTNSTSTEIDAYYGNIGTLTGDSLKNYLYTKISTHFIDDENDTTDLKYYQVYGKSGVTKWYKITDRNWSLSRSISESTYKFADDSGNNYYETMLYFEDNSTQAKQINTDVNGFTGVTGLTSIDWTNKQVPKASGIYGNNEAQVDKEHVWVKSHGFSPSGDPSKGAGTDLHHLIAADHNTNNIHNDLCYGEVADHSASSTTTVYCVYGDGTYDVSGWRGKSSLGEQVFEPTDTWKGNVARALLYMATRYGKQITGTTTNSQYEPYLHFMTYSSTSTEHSFTNNEGVFHNLDTFLSWNELDPVDSYEEKRNNLIYKNVQDNRNPYVDHPEWARRVFDPNYKLDDSGDEGDKTSSSISSSGKDSSIDSSIPSTDISSSTVDSSTSNSSSLDSESSSSSETSSSIESSSSSSSSSSESTSTVDSTSESTSSAETSSESTVIDSSTGQNEIDNNSSSSGNWFNNLISSFGCSGSIAVTSSLFLATSLFAVGLLIKKKKEK